MAFLCYSTRGSFSSRRFDFKKRTPKNPKVVTKAKEKLHGSMACQHFLLVFHTLGLLFNETNTNHFCVETFYRAAWCGRCLILFGMLLFAPICSVGFPFVFLSLQLKAVVNTLRNIKVTQEDQLRITQFTGFEAAIESTFTAAHFAVVLYERFIPL